jgi:hypothetical protein
MPDFTDCSFGSREPDADFYAVIHQGGPVRGSSPIMPAHGQTLGEEGIRAVLTYLRTLCANPSWSRGDLVPQLQVTLSPRQHVLLGAGVRIPLTHRRTRPTRVVVYLLWDWYDGGLTEGW